MADAPDLGVERTVNGKVYRRILSLEVVKSIQMNTEFKPYESVSAPRGLDKIDPSIKVNPKTGRPIIENRKQEREVGKKTGKEWL